MQNDDGLFLPESLFLDATFYPIGGGERLRLSRVTVDHQEVTLFIGDDVTEHLASATFDLVSPPDNLAFQDVYDRPAGLIVSEAARLAVFQAWPTGSHAFSVDQSELAATCCIPTPEIGVRGFLTEAGDLLTGDVWLVGDDGVVLSKETIVDSRAGVLGGVQTYEVIRVDIVGDPLFRRRLCQGNNNFVSPRLLQQLTVQDGCRKVVCLPDEYGDFKISVGHQDAVDTILRIRSTPAGLVIEAVGEKLKSIQ